MTPSSDEAAVAPPSAPATGEPAPSSAPPAGSQATTLASRLTVLDGLSARALGEHAEIYQGLHADLQAALAEIDSA